MESNYPRESSEPNEDLYKTGCKQQAKGALLVLPAPVLLGFGIYSLLNPNEKGSGAFGPCLVFAFGCFFGGITLWMAGRENRLPAKSLALDEPEES